MCAIVWLALQFMLLFANKINSKSSGQKAGEINIAKANYYDPLSLCFIWIAASVGHFVAGKEE